MKLEDIENKIAGNDISAAQVFTQMQDHVDYWNRQVLDLRNTIIDLKACLRTCKNSATGGLDQYPD